MRGANDFLLGTRSSTSARGRREAGLEGSAGERGTSRARRRDGRERVGTGDRAPGASGGETANPAPRFGAGGRAENTFPRSRSLARRARETRRTSKRARAFSAARLGTRTVRACPLVDGRVELWSGANDALAGWKNIEARTPPPDAERVQRAPTTRNERRWGLQVDARWEDFPRHGAEVWRCDPPHMFVVWEKC